MDPISAIVTALVLGASSELKDTAAQAIKDSYTGLKTLLQRKYPRVSVTQLEEVPESKSRRSVLVEDLEKTAAAQDVELLQRAKNLLDAIQNHTSEAAGVIAVDLENIKAASLQISELLSSGTGVKIKGADISGDIDIHGIRAGIHGPEPPKS